MEMVVYSTSPCFIPSQDNYLALLANHDAYIILKNNHWLPRSPPLYSQVIWFIITEHSGDGWVPGGGRTPRPEATRGCLLPGCSVYPDPVSQDPQMLS